MQIKRALQYTGPSIPDIPACKLKIIFPLPIIEKRDINNVEAKCRGFCHGGNIPSLKASLAAGSMYSGGLRNTTAKKDSAVKAESAQNRDRSTTKPDNLGVYFRFVRKGRNEDEDIIGSLIGGPGSGGGVYFFMELRQSENREITTLSSTDTKYGFSTPEGAARNFMDAAEFAYKNSTINNTEIAFFMEVQLTDIKYIFIDSSKVRADKLNELMEEMNKKNFTLDTTITFRQKHFIKFKNSHYNATLGRPSIASMKSISQFKIVNFTDGVIQRPDKPPKAIKSSIPGHIIKPKLNIAGQKSDKY